MIKDRQLYMYILLLFMAVEIILAFSAFGFIVMEPVSITFMTVPVLCGAYVLGPGAGAILGCVFGLVSIWKASVSAFTTLDMLFSPVFSGAPVESLVMGLGTRVAFGWLAGMLFVQVRKRQASKLWFAAAILAASIFHSLSVFLCLHLFFPETDIGLGYGVRRLASVSTLINYSIVVLLVFLLDKCLRLPLMRHLASELKYSRDATRSRTFYIVNAVLLAALFLVALGLMYHFYDRASSLLEFYGIEMGQAVHTGWSTWSCSCWSPPFRSSLFWRFSSSCLATTFCA